MTEQIFSQLTSFEDTEPEVFCMPKRQSIHFHENEDSFEFWYDKGETYIVNKKNWNVQIKKGKVLLFQIKYFCDISKSIVEKKDLFSTTKGYALNNHVVREIQHTRFSLKPVYYINIPKGYTYKKKIYNFSFVFNIVDMRKIYANLHNKLLESLPLEMVLHIMEYENFEKKGDGLFQVTDFPFDFSQEFQGKIPEKLSKSQLKKLYEIGAIKLALTSNGLRSKIVLTDESYEHVYPMNAPNVLHNIFKSKEEMHEVKDAFLEEFFDE